MERAEGLVVLDPMFLARRIQLAEPAAKNRLPAIYGIEEHVVSLVRRRGDRVTPANDRNWHEAADRRCVTSWQILRVERTCHGRRRMAESDVVDGARSQQRGAIG